MDDPRQRRLILLDEHARELVRGAPDWHAYRWELIGGTATEPAKLIRVDGAVAPPLTRGADAGTPDWSRIDRETVRTAYFTPAEHQDWCRRWEENTGKCAHCVGTGLILVAWTHSQPPEAVYRPCSNCQGTGVPARLQGAVIASLAAESRAAHG